MRGKDAVREYISITSPSANLKAEVNGAKASTPYHALTQCVEKSSIITKKSDIKEVRFFPTSRSSRADDGPKHVVHM